MRHPAFLLVVFLVLLGAGTVGLVIGGSQGVAIATVLAVTVAALALAVQLFGVPWASPDQAKLESEARKLADAVAGHEREQQNLFLADSALGTLADVSFDAPQRPSWPDELVVWRRYGGPQSGSLTDIAGFYAGSNVHHGVDNGRLVVLGEPGAGKTVLANQLLLDLIIRPPASKPSSGEQRRVPIRLSLPGFDPGADDGQIGAAVVASRLDAWIKGQLVDAYDMPPRVADALVDGGWILPVLDGLDEMDPDMGDPVRAAATVRALNYSSSGGVRPIVVTCRNNRYKQLAASASSAHPGQEPVLQDAAVIELQPLDATQIRAYLIRRFPARTDSDVQIQRRWQPVLDDLKPGSLLAATLGSPLRLFMAVTAYFKGDTTPENLCKLQADIIDQDLLERFIPAITEQRPHLEDKSKYYESDDVTCWLGTLARHLQVQQQKGGSGSDIEVTTLWTAAGPDVPRWRAAALYDLFVGMALLCAGGLYLAAIGHVARDLAGRAAIVFGVALVAFVTWRSSRPDVRLVRFDLSRVRTAGGRRGLAAGLMFGFMCGVLFGAVVWLAHYRRYIGFSSGLVDLFVTGLAGALLGALAWPGGLSRSPSIIGRPGELIAQGFTHDGAALLASGLGGMLLWGWVPAHAFGLAFGSYGLATGFAFGSALGALFVADSPWIRYLVATRLLARRQELPQHLARFLDWAYSAGLLRMAGISVQFRHSELQTHLAKFAGQATGSTPSLDQRPQQTSVEDAH